MSGVFLHRAHPRFALFFNLKVGYSTLSRALPQAFPAVEALRAPRFRGPPLAADAVPTFLIVRNPYDRVASFFADKCRAQPRDRALHNHRLQDCQRVLLRALGRFRDAPDPDFATLLSLQLDDLTPVLAAVAARDPHLARQVDVLRVPWFPRTHTETLAARMRARAQTTPLAIPTGAAHARLARATYQLHAWRAGQPPPVRRLVVWPSQILRLEHLASAWPRFEDAVGRAVPLVARNAQSSKIAPPRWTPTLIAAVQSVYAEDFAAFGYPTTPPSAENLAGRRASGQHSAHGKGNP